MGHAYVCLRREPRGGTAVCMAVDRVTPRVCPPRRDWSIDHGCGQQSPGRGRGTLLPHLPSSTVWFYHAAHATALRVRALRPTPTPVAIVVAAHPERFCDIPPSLVVWQRIQSARCLATASGGKSKRTATAYPSTTRRVTPSSALDERRGRTTRLRSKTATAGSRNACASSHR